MSSFVGYIGLTAAPSSKPEISGTSAPAITGRSFTSPSSALYASQQLAALEKEPYLVVTQRAFAITNEARASLLRT
jgi:hypothetical protein